jgi:hypothetical protein
LLILRLNFFCSPSCLPFFYPHCLLMTFFSLHHLFFLASLAFSLSYFMPLRSHLVLQIHLPFPLSFYYLQFFVHSQNFQVPGHLLKIRT